MKIALVIGSAISTIHNERINGAKLLMLKEATPSGDIIGKPYVAVDLVDAGEGDFVLTCHGSAARQSQITKETPVDAVVMAVLDHIELNGEIVYKKV